MVSKNQPSARPKRAIDGGRAYVAPSIRRLGHMSEVAQKSGPTGDTGQPTKA